MVLPDAVDYELTHWKSTVFERGVLAWNESNSYYSSPPLPLFSLWFQLPIINHDPKILNGKFQK